MGNTSVPSATPVANPSREQVYLALFALVTPLQGPPKGPLPASKPFRLVTRKVLEVQRIPPEEQPVLMMYESTELPIWNGEALQSKVWTVYFIIGAEHSPSDPGASILNPLIDAVEAALLPNPLLGQEVQTLGALVTRAVVKGVGAKDHGDNSTKTGRRQSAYYLPVEITLPNS